MSNLVLRVAAKAVIIRADGKVLIVREGTTYADGSQIGLYGLPGGRLDVGESFEAGLAREAKEETGLKIKPLYPLYVGEWRPTIKDVPHQIVAVFMACKALTTKVTLSDEHDGFEWIDPKNRGAYKFMDPDDKVLDALIARQDRSVGSGSYGR